MSKRFRWSLAVAALALLIWWLWPAGSPAPSASARADGGAASSVALAADLDGSDGGPEATAASLSGRVLSGPDAGVAEALVVAEDSQGRLQQTRSGDGGRYRFDGLAPGGWTLAAQAGAAIAAPLGPIPVSPGDDLRDIDLSLVPGVAVSGRVLDLRSRNGVPGAQLQILATPFSTLSGPDGRYRFAAIPAGRQTLLVLADAYLPRKVAIDYPGGATAAGLDVYLRPATHVEGTVVGPDGAPVAGASLWLWRYQATDEGPALAPLGVTSDADGRFAADVEAGVCRFVARSRGRAEGQSEQLDLAEGQRRTGVQVRLGAGGEVDGLVLLPGGAPASGGQVQALGGAGRWPVGQAPIDRSGHFQLAGLPAGHLALVADAAQARGSADADLSEGGQVEVQIQLGDGTVDGTVVDADGQPVGGALVVARPVGLGAAGERQTLSGADGRFKLSGLSGNRFDLAASKDQGSAELRGIAAGTHGVQLSLAIGRVSGYVTTPDSGGVSDFTLSAEPEVPGHGRPRSKHVLDGRGEFSLPLAPGAYVLRATAPGYADGEARGVSVAAGQETAGVHIELRPSGTVEGLVLDATSGAPVVGVNVAIDRSHAWAVGRTGSGGAGGGTSGVDGRFVIRDVAPGNYALFASSPDYEQNWPPPSVAVQPGEDSPSVEVRVHRAKGNREQEYAGVGLSFFPNRQGNMQVVEVFPGGPAWEAGIRSGDEILAIDGQPTAALSMGDVSNRIRGPVGSEVTLDMQRGGNGPGYEVVVPRGDIKFF